jgi:hypothetical protein
MGRGDSRQPSAVERLRPDDFQALRQARRQAGDDSVAARTAEAGPIVLLIRR